MSAVASQQFTVHLGAAEEEFSVLSFIPVLPKAKLYVNINNNKTPPENLELKTRLHTSQ